jgi:hypothetical protein
VAIEKSRKIDHSGRGVRRVPLVRSFDLLILRLVGGLSGCSSALGCLFGIVAFWFGYFGGLVRRSFSRSRVQLALSAFLLKIHLPTSPFFSFFLTRAYIDAAE